MRIKLQHGTRCVNCGARLPAGTEAEWYPPAAGVEAETTCVVCPERPQRPAKAQNVDTSSLYEGNHCSSCNEFWTARRSECRLPATSPCCDAAWCYERRAEDREPRDDDQQPLRLVVG